MALGCVCYAHGHRKKALSPSEIGEILGISRPAITAILNTLEEKELILRTMDHLDKRRILVELSQKGRAGLEEIENEMLKRVGQIMPVSYTHLYKLPPIEEAKVTLADFFPKMDDFED